MTTRFTGARDRTVWASVEPEVAQLLQDAADRRESSLSRLIYVILRNATQNFTSFEIADQPLVIAEIATKGQTP